MGYFLYGFKERINKNCDISIEQAQKNVLDILADKNNIKLLSSLAKKEHMARNLKVIIANEFGLKPEDIVYNVTKMSKGTEATVSRFKGDGKYIVNLNEVYIERLSLFGLMKAILHELGHVDLMLRECRGEKVPEAVYLNTAKVRELPAWQKFGSDMKYISSDNELYANLFAINKIKEWISLSKRVNGSNKQLTRYKKACDIEEFIVKLGKAEGLVLHNVWRGINKLLNIKDETGTYIEPCTSGFSSIVLEINDILAAAGLRESLSAANNYMQAIDIKLKNHENYAEINNSAEKMLYTNYLCMLFADKVGISTNEIGFCIDNHQIEPVKFIKIEQHLQTTPIKCFFCINDETYNKANFIDFVSCINEVATCSQKEFKGGDDTDKKAGNEYEF